MSLTNNVDFNGLELGLQRRINFQFVDIANNSPIVLRFSSTTDYRLLGRVVHIYQGGVQYDVVVNPTSIDTVGSTPVPTYRNNTKIQSTPITTTITSGWEITYDQNDRTQVVDRVIANVGSSNNATIPPPDIQMGGRIFTSDDVFFLVLRRWSDATANPSGFLDLLWQQSYLGE